MKYLFRILATLTFIVSVSAPVPALAATNLFKDACTGSGASAANNSAVCKDGQTTTNPLTGADGLIVQISRIIAFVSGTAAVIILMVSGLRYILSSGDTAKTVQARNGIIYALAGLIIIISAQYIISLVMRNL